MSASQQFSLRWNNYLKHITSAFDSLRTDEDLVDVTLSCEGKRLRAHKMLLSACSTYFRDLFRENPCQHPVVIFRNVKFDDLAALVDFIYQGEVNVVQDQLDSFMTTAELLAVQGLTDGSRKDDCVEEDIVMPNEPEIQLTNISGKVITNNKRNKSPGSPFNSHKTDSSPNKKRRYRENNAHSEKTNRHNASKDPDNGKTDLHASPDPVEIIPLMPNLKMEMPEYLEQDGSSCSYEEQSTGESSTKIIEDGPDIIESEHKPEIGQPFYSGQNTDNLDVTKSSDIGYLLSKPSTSSGDRISHESLEQPGETGPNPQDLGMYVDDDDNEQVSDSELLYRCRICWKGFKHPISLTLHKDLHTGQTRCPICHRIFSRSYDMRVHLLRIHKKSSLNDENNKATNAQSKKKK